VAKAKGGVPTELLLGAAAIGGAFLLLKGASGGDDGNGGDIPPGPVPAGSITITDVVVHAGSISMRYSDGATLIPVNVGQIITADVTWRNDSDVSLRPIFRLDAKSSTRMTWREGSEKNAPSSAQPGATGTAVIEVALPGDWNDGTVELKIQAIGTEPPYWAPHRMLEYVQDVSNLSVTYSSRGEVLPGDTLAATLRFTHRGQSISIWCGLGVAYARISGYNAPFSYFASQVNLLGDVTPTVYEVTVPITIPDVDGVLDAQRFISLSQPAINQQPPNDFGLNAWDDGVWSINTRHEYSDLLASYNGRPIGSTNIDLYDFSAISVELTFRHRGPAAVIVAAVGLNWAGTPFWVQAIVSLSDDASTHSYIMHMGNTFVSPNNAVSVGRTIDTMKALQVVGGSLDIGGNGMLLADADRDVFTYRGVLADTPRWNVGDRPGAGITIVNVSHVDSTWLYSITFDEQPGVVYGPMTEAEVLAQIG